MFSSKRLIINALSWTAACLLALPGSSSAATVSMYLDDIAWATTTVNGSATSPDLEIRFTAPAAAPIWVANATGFDGATPPPAGHLSSVHLKQVPDDYLFREQLERCHQLGLLVASRPEKYRLQVYLGIPDPDTEVSYPDSQTMVVRTEGVLLCGLNRQIDLP